MAKGKTPPKPHVYQDMNEVPVLWRTYRSGRLSLLQVNRLMERSYAMGHWEQHPNGDAYFVPDEGRARQEFESQNENSDGLWVPKAKS